MVRAVGLGTWVRRRVRAVVPPVASDARAFYHSARLCVAPSRYFLDEYRYAPKGAVLAHEMTGVKADMDEETGMKFTLAITTKSRVYVPCPTSHVPGSTRVLTLPCGGCASQVRHSGRQPP